MSREWTAKWIGRQDDDTFNPVFFKDFSVDYPISKATFFITALGVYEAYINGQRVGNDYLTPARNDEGNDVPFDQYDITDLLYVGPEAPSNSIDIFLGHGWKDDDDRIALRAEIVLERSGEPAEEALAMEFDEIIAEPGEFEDDFFELGELDSFLTEDDPFAESDAFLEELIVDEPTFDDESSFDDAPALPEIMDMPDTLASRENRPRRRRMRKKGLAVVQDPDLEAAGVLLADEEPDFEVFSEPVEEKPSRESRPSKPLKPSQTSKASQPTKPSKQLQQSNTSQPIKPSKQAVKETPSQPSEEDLFGEDMIEDLFSESDFAEDLPEGLPKDLPQETPVLEPLPNDIPVVQKAMKRQRHVETTRLVIPEPEPVPEQVFGFSDKMPSETAMSEEEIQAILAEQEKKMAYSIPKYFEKPPAEEEDLFTEADLENALQDTGDFSAEDESFDVDSLVDEIANEIGGEPAGSAEAVAQEPSWNDDVEGQVSFDFLGKIQEIMDEEKVPEDVKATGEEGLNQGAAENVAALDKSRFDTKVFRGELDALMTEILEEAPTEASVEDAAVDDFTEDLFDESLLEDLPEEEISEDLFAEISDELAGTIDEVISEDITESDLEGLIDEAALDEAAIDETHLNEAVIDEAVVEETAVEEAPAAEETPAAEEVSVTEETPVAEETPAAEKQPEKKKGLFGKRLKAFDLAKKIGLTLGDEEERPEAEAPDEADEYDVYDDEDLAKLDELGELLADTNKLADMEAVMVGLNEQSKESSPSVGPGFGMELPSFEDLFAAAEDVGTKAAGTVPVPVLLPEEEAVGEAVDEAEENAAEVSAGAAPVPVVVPEMEEIPEPIVVIGTDETWGYYGSDVEKNKIHGLEIFNRLLWDGKDNPDKDALVLDLDIPLTDHTETPLTVMEELAVQSVTPAGGDNSVDVWMLDFGKVFNGFVSFQSEFQAGTKITLTFMNTPADEDSEQQFVYVSDGIGETVCPHFTMFRGRYVMVEGWVGMPDASLFTGYRLLEETEVEAEPVEEVEEAVDESAEEAMEEVAEELEEVAEEAVDESAEEAMEEVAEELEEVAEEAVGFATTSEERLNQTVQDLLETQSTRFASLGAGEKIATGEMCALMQTSAMNGNIKEQAMQYFGKLREAQIARGKAIPSSIPDDPQDPSGASIVDGAEAVKAVWNLYESYGDKMILEQNYDLIKDMLASVSEQAADGYIADAPKPEDDDTDPTFIATVSYYEMAETAAKAAKILQKEDDEKQFADLAGNIKEAFLDEFFSRSGRLAEDTQTAYVLALRSGLCDQKEKLAEDFLKQLKRDQYQPKCGKMGRRELPFVLADCGESELAYRYLTNDWIFEDGDDVNERSAEFLTKYVNGIQVAEPGFSKVKIAPVPNFRLIDSAGSCATPQGDIVSNWSVNEEGQIHFHFDIPEGVEAHLVLPDCPDDAIKEQTLTGGTYDFDYLPTKDYLHLFNEDSMIGDLLKYDESIAIIEETDTSLAEQIENAGMDLLMKPLADLPVDAEKLSAIKEKLFALK